MFINHIKKILSYIFLSKKVLRIPSKKKVLLWDAHLENYLIKYIRKKDLEILYSRGESFNLIILLKILLKFKFSLVDYFNEYIKVVNPKILITFIDNHETFYKLKKNKKSIKILIQNAWRMGFTDIFGNIKILKKNKKDFQVDQMLVFNDGVGKKYTSFIKGKYKVIGSFRSNSNIVKKIKNKKFDLFYISVWRDINYEEMITPKTSWGHMVFLKTKLLRMLLNFSKKKELKLTIYGCRPDINSQIKEKIFYENILGKGNFNFLPNNRSKTYQYTDQAKLVISIDSTLGYESLARGNKTIFFDIRSFEKNLRSRKFGWPYNLANNGFFWTRKLSQDSCNKILERVLKISEKKWKKTFKKIGKKLIIFDNNNNEFRKIIKNYN